MNKSMKLLHVGLLPRPAESVDYPGRDIKVDPIKGDEAIAHGALSAVSGRVTKTIFYVLGRRGSQIAFTRTGSRQLEEYMPLSAWKAIFRRDSHEVGSCSKNGEAVVRS